MNTRGLKFKLLSFTCIIIGLMVGINIYFMFSTKSIENQYSNMINKVLTINEINQDVNNSVFYFDKYFSTKVQSDLDNYRRCYEDARKKVIQLEDFFVDDENSMVIRDVDNILDSYHEYGEEAVYKFLTSGKSDEFYPYFVDAKRVASYSNDQVEKLHDNYIKYNSKIYQNLVTETERSRVLVVVFLIIIVLVCAAFAVIFSDKITIPINGLVLSAQKVSKGNFNIDEIKPSGMYEVDILADGFNTMVRDVKGLVKTIQEKADLEKQLKDQEMKNLLVENMLRQAQFKALQSQINPHFLFNTLNAVVQTAVIEGAYETEKLMNSVSKLLRYSLTMIDSKSTVEEELEIIKQYIYIQETRFADRVSFKIDVDDKLLNVEIPGMTLQPLVENAFIHGIECKEEGGEIDIRVYEDNSNCIIRIQDNGIGIPAKKINEILYSKESNSHIGHTTGIGVGNVINRLKILYDSEDVFDIFSEVGSGTSITIKIPLSGEV